MKARHRGDAAIARGRAAALRLATLARARRLARARTPPAFKKSSKPARQLPMKRSTFG